MCGAGGKLVSGAGKEASCADVLGVCLLHAGHDVNSRLRRYRLRQPNRTILHGLLHSRRIGSNFFALFLNGRRAQSDLNELNCDSCVLDA